jgi:ribosomal protein L7/L12
MGFLRLAPSVSLFLDQKERKMTCLIVSVGEDTQLSVCLPNHSEHEIRKLAIDFVASLVGKDVPPVQDKYNVVHYHCGDKKIEVIRVIRSLTGWPLKEAKDASECTSNILSDVDYDTAQKACEALRSAGADASFEFIQ